MAEARVCYLFAFCNQTRDTFIFFRYRALFYESIFYLHILQAALRLDCRVPNQSYHNCKRTPKHDIILPVTITVKPAKDLSRKNR